MRQTTELTIAVTDRDHAQGPSSAPVTLVEYGDYQCPYCLRAYPIVKKIQQRMGDHLRFVFRNFPITSSHQYAKLAAETAEAAADQGKFWEMHDALFENQVLLGEDLVMQLAATLGLDVERFAKALESGEFRGRVKTDFMGGVKSGVNGTPGFFINGRRFVDSWDFEPLYAALAEEATARSAPARPGKAGASGPGGGKPSGGR
jgi:protein-disulfide isomerase